LSITIVDDDLGGGVVVVHDRGADDCVPLALAGDRFAAYAGSRARLTDITAGTTTCKFVTTMAFEANEGGGRD
jgi:hypothetical protein